MNDSFTGWLLSPSNQIRKKYSCIHGSIWFIRSKEKKMITMKKKKKEHFHLTSKKKIGYKQSIVSFRLNVDCFLFSFFFGDHNNFRTFNFKTNIYDTNYLCVVHSNNKTNGWIKICSMFFFIYCFCNNENAHKISYIQIK